MRKIVCLFTIGFCLSSIAAIAQPAWRTGAYFAWKGANSSKFSVFSQTVLAQTVSSNPATTQIPHGRYIGESPSEALIEIKTNQYCGANLVTNSMDCYPISDLKYIKPGIVQDKYNTYFCSEKIFDITSSADNFGRCTANGWEKWKK